MVVVLLLLEMAIVAQPAVRAGLGELPGPEDFATPEGLDPPRRRMVAPVHGMLLASCMILLVTAGAALVTTVLRQRSRSWVATYTAAHAAAAGLGWAHGMPILTLVATVVAVAVPALVLLPRQPPQ